MNRRISVPVPTRRALIIGAWVVGLLLIGVVLWMLWMLADLGQRHETEAAERAVDFFASCLTHTTGQWRGQPFGTFKVLFNSVLSASVQH